MFSAQAVHCLMPSPWFIGLNSWYGVGVYQISLTRFWAAMAFSEPNALASSS